uniref:Uncharacterized protein n=1 Tax=Cacopsylla melanoneura TaxID=428564 RepID=A0A8D9E3K9_9HEMI
MYKRIKEQTRKVPISNEEIRDLNETFLQSVLKKNTYLFQEKKVRTLNKNHQIRYIFFFFFNYVGLSHTEVVMNLSSSHEKILDVIWLMTVKCIIDFSEVISGFTD